MAPARRPSANDLGRGRPFPPIDMMADPAPRFAPAPDAAAWLTDAFIARDAWLRNDDHEHLRHAAIGVVWTNVRNVRSQRRIVGMAELMPPQGMTGKWQRARAAVLVESWFPRQRLDFLITLDALYCAHSEPAAFCALVEHELYHCAQEQRDGAPVFRKDGTPRWAMRGHDVEEFTGIVRRYGAAASNAGALIEAAKRRPEVSEAALRGICGSCLRLVA